MATPPIYGLPRSTSHGFEPSTIIPKSEIQPVATAKSSFRAFNEQPRFRLDFSVTPDVPHSFGVGGVDSTVHTIQALGDILKEGRSYDEASAWRTSFVQPQVRYKPGFATA